MDMSGAAILDRYYTEWECPRCGLNTRTAPMPPNSAQMHNCPKLAGLTAPLVWAGFDATTELVPREDYVGGERIHEADDGKAYMAVRTRHANGRQDCTVLAPCATATIRL